MICTANSFKCDYIYYVGKHPHVIYKQYSNNFSLLAVYISSRRLFNQEKKQRIMADEPNSREENKQLQQQPQQQSDHYNEQQQYVFLTIQY